jgi:hypothetical protein
LRRLPLRRELGDINERIEQRLADAALDVAAS